MRRWGARLAERLRARYRRAARRHDILKSLAELQELESRPIEYGTRDYWRRVELVRWLETDDAGVPQ